MAVVRHPRQWRTLASSATIIVAPASNDRTVTPFRGATVRRST
jgi:hypothetical protein